VINIWGRTVDSSTYSNALAINGRHRPNTERMAATVGDTLRWRVINATVRSAPMHLHGFYFDRRVPRRRESRYAVSSRVVRTSSRRNGAVRHDGHDDRCGASRQLAVPLPHRVFMWFPGSARLSTDSAEAAHRAMSGAVTEHMAVSSWASLSQSRPGARERVREQARRLSATSTSPALDTARHVRSATSAANRARTGTGLCRGRKYTLMLTRGEPTDITVHNRLKEATAVHWHGIEPRELLQLTAWSDGAAPAGALRR